MRSIALSRLHHFGVALLFGATALSAAAATKPVADELRPKKLKLVWEEDFNTDGPLDPAHWDYEHGFVRNQEVQWYQPQNAVCENGCLVITAKKETVSNTAYDATSKDWHFNRKEAHYTSSSVMTKGRHWLHYGRMEVRAKIPVTDGSWPAIWCLGNKDVTGPWPACGEVDIMEFYTHDILANTAWSNEQGGAVWNAKHIPFTHFTERDSLWAEKFHTWRMDWDSLAIRIYLDDELLNETDLRRTSQRVGDFCRVENPFRTPQYLLLNLALRASDGIDEKYFPLHYYIDYVRFYEWE